MPYRRLPNTDASRLRALKIAYEKGKELPPFKLAFSQPTLQKIQSFLPSYEKTLLESKQAFNKQTENSKNYLKVLKKAKLYISHFIQVLNLAIMRGDLPKSERNYFGLAEETKKVPDLNAESDVIKWGEKIIHGETIRAQERRAPITNPTIAVVKVRYENFLDSYKFQKTLQRNHHRALEKLEELRLIANDIILSIWNEVEDKYKNETDIMKRKLSSEYGIVYVFRKSELKKVKISNHSSSLSPS